MSRASRQSARARASSPAAAPSPAGPAAPSSSFIGWGAGNGHQGADYSRLRGYVYFPELDTRKEITPYSRTEILRRSRFLVANYGIARRIKFGLARMVAGTGLTPQATTDDREWNKLAEKAFARVADSRFSYDLGGRYNFYRSQAAVLGFRFGDGDYAQAVSRAPNGASAMAFYEAHQIGNGPEAAPNMIDGVHLDRWNRAAAYRLLGDDGKFTDLPASAVIFGCNYERAGQSRGLSIFSHAINHLLDAAEIQSYIKSGVKLANRFGHWIEYAAGASKSRSPGDRASGPVVNDTTAAGEPVQFERIYGPGTIPDLPPGATLKTNASSHPHPNNLNLIDYLIRDVAWGAGLAPEIIWNIATLGGANTRFVLADAQGWLEFEQQDLVDTKLQRDWLDIIAVEMASGRLRRCQDPEWWKTAWIPPPRLTVDFGRDGKLHLEMIKAGALTYKRLFGWQGLESEAELNTALDEIKFIKDGLATRGLTWADWAAMRNSAGNNATPAAPDASAPDQPENNADTAAALAEIAKDPARAQAYLKSLMAQPLPEAA